MGNPLCRRARLSGEPLGLELAKLSASVAHALQLGAALAVTMRRECAQRARSKLCAARRSDRITPARPVTEAVMLRFLLLTGALLLATESAFAQVPDAAQCQQIKEAVARYGYAAARRHAVVTYGPEAARAGDQCFSKLYRTHYRKHYGA